MPIRLDGSTGITVGTAVTVGTSDIRIGNNVDIDATSIVGVSTIGVTTAYVTSVNDGPISGFRNRIINGDMRIDQRNVGAAVTPTTSSYTVDRWQYQCSVASKMTLQQNAGAVTPPAFFDYYLGATTSSAYTAAAGEVFEIAHKIEGFNFSDMAWGTSNAKSVTLSFWVRSSLTGTHSGSFTNNAGNRSYIFTFTISASNTWEYKTITIPGDTTGTWIGSSTSAGVVLYFDLGSGSNFRSTSGSWSVGNYVGATSAVSVIGTNGATFYITGVQLEPGPVVTPFERRSFGQELFLCQRYYEKSYELNVVPGTATYNGMIQVGDAGFTSTNATIRLYAPFRVSKRTTSPTVTWYDSAGNSGKCNLPDTTTNRTITPIYTNNMGASVEGYSASATTDHRMYIHYVCSDEL